MPPNFTKEARGQKKFVMKSEQNEVERDNSCSLTSKNYIQSYFLSLLLGLRSLSMMPRVKLRASFSCLCSDGLIFPTSGSHTVTSSFVEAIGDGIKKFAPDSYT